MTIDKATLQILADHCAAAAEAMAFTLMRTSHSTFVKETEDFSCGLLTPDGVTFASPRTLGATWYVGLDYGPAIRAIETYEEGDICVTNDPYSGFVATHPPDMHIWKPVFWQGEIVCFVAGHIHNTDVGGAVPASLSRSLTEVYQEGIRIPPTKLFAKGVLDQRLLDFLSMNVRQPEQNRGDLMAQIASVATGERRVLEMIERFGIETFQRGIDGLLAYAAEQAAAIVRTIPDGTYFHSEYADEDSDNGHPCRLAVTMTVSDGSIVLDFTGSDPQVGSSLNVPTGGGERHVLPTVGFVYALYTLARGNLILNAGIMRVVRCILPEGTIVNPVMPAAVGMRSLTCATLQTLLIGVFSLACPDRFCAGPAGGRSIMNVKTSTRDGRPIMASIGPVGGGGGGMPDTDGEDGAGANGSFLRNTPVEINEVEVPIRILRYGLEPDSGGAGRVPRGESPAGLLREAGDALRERTAIERLAPRAGDLVQRVGLGRKTPALACGRRAPMRHEGVRIAGLARKLNGGVGPLARDHRRDREAVPREADRRLEEGFERQRTEALGQGHPRRHGTGHGDRAPAQGGHPVQAGEALRVPRQRRAPGRIQTVQPVAVPPQRERVAAELKTTFSSHYTQIVSLPETLQLSNIAIYAKRATGEKFLINPNKT